MPRQSHIHRTKRTHSAKSAFRVAGCDVRVLDIRDLTEQDLKEVARALPYRYKRAREFLRLKDRLRCLGAGKLMIEELGIASEEQLVLDAHGKLSAPDLARFNLSHSGNYVVIATSTRPVGVDTEEKSERHLSVAGRVFTPREVAWMKHDPLDRFHLLWTQKEAAMKLDGRGLAIDPATFEMDPCGTTGRTVIGGRTIETASLFYEENAVSVAVYAESMR